MPYMIETWDKPDSKAIRASARPAHLETMPYLQLDVPYRYPAEVKRALARRLGDHYARIMQTTPELYRRHRR
jgi:hypothetical protein